MTISEGILHTPRNNRFLAPFIDYAALHVGATEVDLESTCSVACHYRFAAVIVHPVDVAWCAKRLTDSGVKLAAVVGFHTGAFTLENKLFEAENALSYGADEIDYVIRVASLKGGDAACVHREMLALRKATAGHTVTAILETCLLTDEEKTAACKFAIDAGIDFVATSTGFSTVGAAIADVQLLAKIADSSALGIKASGGIRSANQALALIDAGAKRLGSSAAKSIMEEMNLVSRGGQADGSCMDS